MTRSTRVLSGRPLSGTDHPVLWAALATLAGLDAATTIVALALGAPEANPLLVALIDRLGLVAVPLSQGVYLGAAGALVAVVDSGERWVLGAGVALSWVVVLNNTAAVLVLSGVVG